MKLIQAFLNNLKTIFVTVIITLSQLSVSFAQRPSNYNDVLVIVNSADTTSVNIGNYFKTKRNIRAKNILSIPMPVAEEITDAQFQTIRFEIQDSMVARNLVTTTNYIVTTKGVPLKICREPNFDCSTVETELGGGNSASFDSELMLMFGIFQNYIGSGGSCGGIGSLDPAIANHPYCIVKNNPSAGYFDSQKYSMYLTTRLTAWTQKQVYNLIDSSGPNIKIDKTKVKIVLDGSSNPNYPGWNKGYLAATKTNLINRGFTAANIVLDTFDTYVRGQSNVFLYWGFGNQHPGISRSNAAPGNTWSRGSFGVIDDFYTARSFSDSTLVAGQYNAMIADWIREGATGMSGLTYNSYLDAWTIASSAFGFYTSPIYFNNLAETYYLTSPSYSWHFVVVGDPKTSIYYATPPVPTPSLTTTDISVCAGDYLQIKSIGNLYASNKNWFNADSNTVKAAGPTYDFTHPNWVVQGYSLTPVTSSAGIYKYTYVAENIAAAVFRQVTVNVGCSGVAEDAPIAQLNVYPNPSNGEVNIDLQLNKESDIKIAVLDVLGKTLEEKSYITTRHLQKMNMSGYTKGIYFIKVQVDGQNTYCKLLLQ